MQKKIRALLLLVLLLGLLVACGGSNTETPNEEANNTTENTTENTATNEEAPAEDSGPRTYVFVPKGLRIPYFDTANIGRGVRRCRNLYRASHR